MQVKKFIFLYIYNFHLLFFIYVSYFNWTPLHIAVKWNRQAMVELLLSYSANVSVKNDSGKIPLNIAENYQLSKIANLLRKAQGEQAIQAALATTE